MTDVFLHFTTGDILQVVVLGFIGGVLSGFVGSGGAFFMTPGMMNLGVPGVIAVGSNITHKFGKAMVGSRKHGELGHVDKKLGIVMLITALIGIRLAVWISTMLFGIDDSHGEKGAAADLYISAVFVIFLGGVAISMLLDIVRSRKGDSGAEPSRRIADYLSKLRLAPTVYFPVADVTVSLWVLMTVGLFTGYMAGTIGVGGFIGVPAMIYVFGVPTAVAAGTELFLAMFMGAFGAINYALEGFVDIRLVAFLYLGSLMGIYVGTYGTKVVNEVMIRFVTAIIIGLCVVSRLIAIPIYLSQMELIDFIQPADYEAWNGVSKIFLYISGIGGVLAILIQVARAFVRRRRVLATILTKTE